MSNVAINPKDRFPCDVAPIIQGMKKSIFVLKNKYIDQLCSFAV